MNFGGGYGPSRGYGGPDINRLTTAPVLPDGRRNYEVPQATDWRSFHRAVAAARRTCQITIVEGFLLFHDPPASFDLGVFIEISQDECKQRRCVEARGHKQSPQFFDAYTWPCYLRYGTARPSTRTWALRPRASTGIFLDFMLNVATEPSSKYLASETRS